MATNVGDLASAGCRSLSFDEFADLRERYRDAQWVICAAAVLTPLLLLAWLIELALLFASPVSFFILLGAGLLILAGAGLLAWFGVRRACAIGRDLSLGSMLELRSDPGHALSPDLVAALQRSGIPSAAAGDGHRFDVLAGSGQVVRADGELLRGWVAVEGLPPLPIGEAGPPKRSLSRSELLEVRRMSAFASAWVWAEGAVFGLAYLAGVGALLRFWPLFLHPAVLTLLGVSLCTGIALSVAIPNSLSLAKDVDAVCVLKHEVSAGADPEHIGDDRPLHRIPVESLPFCGRTWTIDGHAAGWRKAAAKSPAG